MRLRLVEEESHMHFTCDGCIPNIAALHVGSMSHGWLFFFTPFSKNKDRDGNNNRGKSQPNDDRCRGWWKAEKINYGRGGSEEALVLCAAELCRLCGPFICCSNTIIGQGGASEP